jgi:hypothetical protein
MTPSGSVTFSVARRRVLAGPRGLPRARRQDASNSVSTTDVSRHEHSFETSPSETAGRGPWGNPPVRGSQIALFMAFPPIRGRRRTTLRSSSLQRLRA